MSYTTDPFMSDEVNATPRARAAYAALLFKKYEAGMHEYEKIIGQKAISSVDPYSYILTFSDFMYIMLRYCDIDFSDSFVSFKDAILKECCYY